MEIVVCVIILFLFLHISSKELTNPRQSRKKKARSSTHQSQSLLNEIQEIEASTERYSQWWTGYTDVDTFQPVSWSSQHRKTSNAIFTAAIIQGMNDKVPCTSPNNFILYFGTARKVFDGDIVVAIDSETLSPTIKSILTHFRVIVYEISKDLCSKATKSIFCGSADERVPASVFRYYFFEKWAIQYTDKSLILITDFRDVFFQSNPFPPQNFSSPSPSYHDWLSSTEGTSLALFQEFLPNMIVGRCSFNSRMVRECFGQEGLRALSPLPILSSGGLLGRRDPILLLSRHMTLQLQEAPGRLSETRCSSGGIDHAFLGWLLSGPSSSPSSLKSLLRPRVFPQGEGAFNSLGGIRPETLWPNVTGSLVDWGLLRLSSEGRGAVIVNWGGEVSPVVHQLDHFLDELWSLCLDRPDLLPPSISDKSSSKVSLKERHPDLPWQLLEATRCLWGCPSSHSFT